MDPAHNWVHNSHIDSVENMRMDWLEQYNAHVIAWRIVVHARKHHAHDTEKRAIRKSRIVLLDVFEGIARNTLNQGANHGTRTS